MSRLGGVLDALEAAAGGAIAGLSVSRQPRQATGVPADQFPHLVLGSAELSTTPGPYGTAVGVWTVGASLLRQRGTLDAGPDGDREVLALDLEALLAAIQADRTLGGACERAWIAEAAIRSNLESGFVELALLVSARLAL